MTHKEKGGMVQSMWKKMQILEAKPLESPQVKNSFSKSVKESFIVVSRLQIRKHLFSFRGLHRPSIPKSCQECRSLAMLPTNVLAPAIFSHTRRGF